MREMICICSTIFITIMHLTHHTPSGKVLVTVTGCSDGNGIDTLAKSA